MSTWVKKRPQFTSADATDLNVTLNEAKAQGYAKLAWAKATEFKIFFIVTFLLTLSEPVMVGYTAAHWFVNASGHDMKEPNQYDNETNVMSNPMYCAQVVVLILSWLQVRYTMHAPR